MENEGVTASFLNDPTDFCEPKSLKRRFQNWKKKFWRGGRMNSKQNKYPCNFDNRLTKGITKISGIV